MDSRLFKLSSYDSECRPSVYRRDKWRACLETHMLLWGQAIRLSWRCRQRCTLCVLAALLLVTSSAFGWGEKGHVMINRAAAMKAGVEAGRMAYRAGRMGKRMYADPSSPLAGLI